MGNKKNNLPNKSRSSKSIIEKTVNLFKKISLILSKKKKEELEKNKAAEIKKEIEPHIEIEKSKFSTVPWETHEHKPVSRDIPAGYNEDKIILQVRDPWWIHSYWEVTGQTKDKFTASLGEQYYQSDWVLRVYDVSFVIFDGRNAHSYFDIPIGHGATNWYINVFSGRSFCVDLGLRLKDGRFITILRSNAVTTPLDGPSWIMDEDWMIPDEEFMKLYGVGFGSSPLGLAKKIKIGEFISSPGFISKPKK